MISRVRARIWLLLLILIAVSISCRLIEMQKIAGYTNHLGNYGFNYPTDWQGVETGSDVIFENEEIKVEIVVNPIQPGESIETILSEIEPGTILYTVENATIDGKPALKRDILSENEEIVRRVYDVFNNNYRYILVMGFKDYTESSGNINHYLKQFDNLVSSFRFLDAGK